MVGSSNTKWELDTISFDISLVGMAAIVDGITRNQPVFHPNTARVCVTLIPRLTGCPTRLCLDFDILVFGLVNMMFVR